MEYVYAAMLLHKAGQDIDEDNVSDVLEAAGIEPDESRVKALIASLEDVDIEDAIENAAVAQPAPSSGAETEETADDGEESSEDESDADEAPDEDDTSEEDAAEGLGNLFE